MSSTRTSSPYFSPNSIIAPSRCAASIAITSAWRGVGEDLGIDDLLDARISSSLIGAVGEVEARLVESTSEPFCCTWAASTSRSALCIRWVTDGCARWRRATCRRAL